MVRNEPTESGDRLDRRAFIKTGAAASVVGLTGLAGCAGGGGGGGGGSGTADSIKAFVWEGWEPVVKAFEEETGISVEQENATSTNNMFTKAKNAPGEYDVVVPNSGYGIRFREADLIQPLGESKDEMMNQVPNFENTFDYFRQGTIANHLTDDEGRWYGAPPRFGLYGLAYDSESIDGEKIQSSADIWENRSNWTDDLGINTDPVHSITHAVRAAGHTDKMRGEKIEVTGSAWEEVRAKFFELADFARATFESEAQFGRAMKSDSYNVGVGPGRNDVVNLIQKGNDNFAYTNPSEGAIGWTEAMFVTKESEKVDAAAQFLDFVLKPKSGAQLATADLAPSTVKNAKEHMSQEEIDLFYVGTDVVSKAIQDKPFANPEKWKSLYSEFKTQL